LPVPATPLRKCPPPRPTISPTILVDEPKRGTKPASTTATGVSTTAAITTTTTTTQAEAEARVWDSLNLPGDHPISLSQEVYHIVVYMGQSSLLLLSYVTWIAGLIILMPALLAAYTLRQLGLLWARQHDVVRPHCVACGSITPAQTMPSSSSYFLPRLSEERNIPPETLILLDGVTTGHLEPLSAPSLRYLPPLLPQTCRCNGGRSASIPNRWSPFVVVAVYLGAPGIRLHALKRLLYNRLFTGRDKLRAHFSDRDVTLGTETPVLSRGLLRNDRYRWFTERLQQYVVALPTGYAWQKCSALNIDDHVVPAFLNSYSNRQTRSPSRLPSPTLRSFELPNDMGDSLDSLIGQIASADLPSGRPLWQVHLVEEFENVTLNGTERADRKDFVTTGSEEKTIFLLALRGWLILGHRD
uniref:MSC domain-containing protein n=1 Tax=Schistocephalus solidus TaxID=70667 RepID=A0A183SAJ8_SCHSO